MSSTASPAESTAPIGAALHWTQTLREQIVRRRIAASLVIFTAMIVADIFLFGVLPRDVFNLADPFVAVGLLLLVTGLATRSWAAGVLHKHKRLTVNGPYSLVRNPLYFGSFLMMFGFALLIDSWWSAPIILGPVAFIYLVQIRHEEKALFRMFGDEWTKYEASTPRFLPRLALPTRSDWSFSQWLYNREWQAIAASIIAVAGLRAWLTFGT